MRCVVLNPFLAIGGLILCFQTTIPAGEDLPTAESIVDRMIDRAEVSNQGHDESKYSYERRNVVEELDKSGKPIERKERIFQVSPIEGVPFSRLIRIQNRELTPEEVKAQDRKEQEFRHRLEQKSSKAHHDHDENMLNRKLIERYDFKMEKRDLLGNRPVFVLSFKPKTPRVTEEDGEDKVLNRLAGKIWVDETDAELVQARLGLTEDLSLGWFGMIGALKQCDVEIERQRLPDGVWAEKRFEVSLGGRKVFGAMHYRTVDERYDFKKF